jgi:hypothetical protein
LTALLVTLSLATCTLVAGIVSPAIGGPDFLTLREAKTVFVTKSVARRTFLSKSAANRRFLTKAAADARFLTPAAGDAAYLPQSGEIRLQVGHSDWQVAGFDVPTIKHFADAVILHQTASLCATSVGCIMVAHPDIPLSLVGQTVRFEGFEVCYDVSPGATLLLVDASRIPTANLPNQPDPIILSPESMAAENTARTDRACRTYNAPSPVELQPNDNVVLGIGASAPGAQDLVGIYRTTLILQVR